MHPAQRHAVIAMVSTIEQTLYNIKQILVMESDYTGQKPLAPQEKPVGAHLSHEEEDTLEKRLEEERQRLLAEHQRVAQAQWEALQRGE